MVQGWCKVILQEEYTSYSVALTKTGLKILSQRREEKCLKSALNVLNIHRIPYYSHSIIIAMSMNSEIVNYLRLTMPEQTHTRNQQFPTARDY